MAMLMVMMMAMLMVMMMAMLMAMLMVMMMEVAVEIPERDPRRSSSLIPKVPVLVAPDRPRLRPSRGQQHFHHCRRESVDW